MWLPSVTAFLLFSIVQWKLSDAGKTVKTTLFSKWSKTPVLAEISELLAKDHESKFWAFVEELYRDNSTLPCFTREGHSCTERFQYELGMFVAEKVTDPTEMGLLRLSLSLRTMSPRVVVHYQLGADVMPKQCYAFFHFKNQRGCHLSELSLSNNKGDDIKIYSFDHVYPMNSVASRTLVIYGELGSNELKSLIFGAKRLIDSGEDLRLVVRHFKPASREISLTALSGYGVELALKNTEYTAHDSDVDEPENLHGFNIKTLIKTHENLKRELESLRDHLRKMGEIAPLNPWLLQDLGFQTCQNMMNNPDIDSIEKTLQDFPIRARAISHSTVDEQLRESIKKQQKKMEETNIENGANILAINGRVIASGTAFVDVLSIIETLREETRAVHEIAGLGFRPETDFSQLLNLADLSPIEFSHHAFDYRETLPAYLNDLETSRGRYHSLELLLQPFPPGQIRPISRNIFTLVLFSDPFDSNDQLFEKIQLLFHARVFIRFGIVPVFNEKTHGMTVQKAVETKSVQKEKRSLWPTKTSLLNAINRGNAFLKKRGLTKTPIALLNGYLLDMTTENFDSVLDSGVRMQTIRLQYALIQGVLRDEVKISDWWLDEETNPDVVARVNQRIISAFNEMKFINTHRENDNLYDKLSYLAQNPDLVSHNADVNTWIVADFENPIHRKFAAEALRSNAVEGKNKVAFVPNSQNVAKTCVRNNSKYVEEELNILINGITPAAANSTSAGNSSCFSLSNSSVFSLTGLLPNQVAVISNGLIIGPLNQEELLTVEDFNYLTDVWKEKNAAKVSEALDREFGNDVSVRFYSTISKVKQLKAARTFFGTFKDPENENVISIPAKSSATPAVTVTWIANPVSREAQQIVSLIKLIQTSVNARTEIIFNPVAVISGMPVRRFYRFVASSELSFDESGSIEAPSSIFSDLPQKQLLTMSLETCDAWMVELKQAEHDLDNIILDTATSNVDGVYSLDHILVEGQSMTPFGSASDGVEMELKSGAKVYDTIVMLNLGYFQLKAEPGVWTLRLRKGGSAEKHTITHLNSKKVNDSQIEIVIDSLTGTWTTVVVAEKEESEEAGTSSLGSLVETARSFFTGGSELPEVINVFSLASGHLYERFMRIMMVSVMKRTKTEKVKFWLLKNYLSPTFKATLPSLAEFYRFDYELVEYKWPKWLHRQTEKQRVMWGYKILFLDVLFPLSVDKIIFVDADQVVRADLQELMDYNLRGAPYGYVPFCESREEMDGFRFWKSGYWKQHLMGKRYHISALYVVDLKKFRQLAAGDRLRGRYSALSSDPGSLSNLDQDLPNNMIHEVPIRTLPQEWLWCETWCDGDSKKNAKTIDLCNNPLTKEPKLNSAQRIIDEWKELDEEVNKVINGQMLSNVKVEL